MSKDKKLQTKLTHIGYNADTYLGGINPPVVRASTITYAQSEDWLNRKLMNTGTRSISYGIQGVEPLESFLHAIRTLENAQHAFALESGLLAITAPICALAKAGDHILSLDNIYAPSRRFFENYLTKNMDVTVDYISPNADIAHIESMIKPNTSLILLEAPGSLTFEIPQLDALYDMCKCHNIISIIDNSWASGYFYQPLDHGADVSAIAATKYIGGHSDLLMGTVSCNDDDIANRIANYIDCMGTYVSPDDLYLALRGIRTLPVRMDAQYQATVKVTQWLENHPRVKQVLCPALPSNPYYDRWKATFSGASSLFSILLDATDEQADAFVNALDLFRIGASWGGYDSLATHNKADRSRSVDTGWSHKGALVRLHIGLDDADDIIADLQQALDTIH